MADLNETRRYAERVAELGPNPANKNKGKFGGVRHEGNFSDRRTPKDVLRIAADTKPSGKSVKI